MCRVLTPSFRSNGYNSHKFSNAGLKYLSLRQNLLPNGDDLCQAEFKSSLQELYVNDNHLKAVPVLSDFTSLKRLELSYNHEVRLCILNASYCLPRMLVPAQWVVCVQVNL